MSLAIRDLVLSGLVYVILTFLSFRLMRHRNKKGGNDNGGQPFELTPPQIDLPPGVDWPQNGPVEKKEIEEELLA